MAGSFIKQIERARAATQPARPAQKPVEEMSGTELDAALIEARREAIEAHKAVAAVAAEQTRTPTLAATLRELKRGKRNRRIR
jgi:hypothetical protein